MSQNGGVKDVMLGRQSKENNTTQLSNGRMLCIRGVVLIFERNDSEYQRIASLWLAFKACLVYIQRVCRGEVEGVNEA